jgi:predicted metal-dependent phosphotriesterase family hydrolase
VAQTTAAEVDADPDGVGLIHEHVHVVIAAAHRAELRRALLAKLDPRVVGSASHTAEPNSA